MITAGMRRASLVAESNTNYNIFLRKRKDVVEMPASVDKCILKNTNASRSESQIKLVTTYNHQMKPSMTVTRPTLMPAICLLGLAIPV